MTPGCSQVADPGDRGSSTRGDKLVPLGAIAQLGERLLCKQEVVGSIPSGSTYELPAHTPLLAEGASRMRRQEDWSS
jgi:hypothetical protein